MRSPTAQMTSSCPWAGNKLSAGTGLALLSLLAKPPQRWAVTGGNPAPVCLVPFSDLVQHSVSPLLPAPVPSFLALVAILQEKELRYLQLLSHVHPVIIYLSSKIYSLFFSSGHFFWVSKAYFRHQRVLTVSLSFQFYYNNSTRIPGNVDISDWIREWFYIRKWIKAKHHYFKILSGNLCTTPSIIWKVWLWMLFYKTWLPSTY